MNLNNFTIKAQEAVQQAVQLVTKNNQQVIEPVHLLKAVIMTGESVTNFIFQKLGVNAQNLNMVLDRQIESYPKVSGGEPYLSSESNAVLQKAIDYSSKMGDQYVSLEPIILALFTEKSTASQILKDAGVTEKELRQAIEELRKGNKVTSQSAEETYDALGKYAINLNERARSGKLDPVIGRDEEIYGNEQNSQSLFPPCNRITRVRCNPIVRLTSPPETSPKKTSKFDPSGE